MENQQKEHSTLPQKITNLFPALSHRNFRLYMVGQSISLIGFWLHQVASAWLVYQLTGSAFWVGTSAAIGGLPFLIFTTFAGVFIDKVNKQKLLIWTQVTEATVALVLGVLVLTGHVNLTIVVIAAFLNGVVGAFDLPTRMTFIMEMVGRRDLASAIPINNGLFNAARFIGPALAGVVIAGFGIGWPFILNGISYIAGIWAILLIRPIFKSETDLDTRPFDALREGLKYSFTHPKVAYFIFLAFCSAIFIWPFQTLMPLVAQDVFASGVQGYGSLLSSAGFGSLFGAIFISANSKRRNKIPLVAAGLLISSTGLLVFSLNRNFTLAHILLFIAGFGTLMMVSTLNSMVQLNSPDKMRARIMAVYLTMFVGMMPVGNQLAGIIAEKTSATRTLSLGAIAMLIVGVFFFATGIFAKLAKQTEEK